MILNKENIINGLQTSNLLGNENHYFTSFILPSTSQYAILGAFAGVLNSFSGYVINTTENGVGILPISSVSGQFVIEKAVFLPYQYIAKVEATNGGLFAYKKINIITINNENISFKVMKKVLTNPEHLNNVNHFLNKFSIV